MDYPPHIVAVSGLFFDRGGKVLLVKTERRGWECPGGQVELGEDLIAALIRETHEESGCEVEVERLAGVYTNPVIPSKVMFQFVGRHVSGAPRGSEETAEAGWFTVDEALGLVTFPANLAKLTDALRAAERPIYRVYSTQPYAVKLERGI
jgi:ADP-ribose pyrophosphatase YjhB (NUDIX family)